MGKPRCTLCEKAHTVTTSKYSFSATTHAAALSLLAAIEGVGESEPWSSSTDRCYVAGSHVLMRAPGQEFKVSDDNIIGCSKAYQAKSSLLLKNRHDQALKSSAAVAAASSPRSDVVAPSTHDTRGLITTQIELSSKSAELADTLTKLDEVRHQLELKSAMVVELETKLGHTQSELVSTRVNLTEAHVELVEVRHQLELKSAMVVELDTKLDHTQRELVSTRVNLTEARVELGEMRAKLDEAFQAFNSCE